MSIWLSFRGSLKICRNIGRNICRNILEDTIFKIIENAELTTKWLRLKMEIRKVSDLNFK